MQNRDPQLLVTGEAIGFYEREFYVLSNFSSFQVVIDGVTYSTAEHAYHCDKFWRHPEVQALIRLAPSAHEAFVLSRRYADRLTPDLDEIKIARMEHICRHKLDQHEYVQRKLEQTGDLVLIEDSPKDSFWGWGPDRQGRNELGKVWMRLREERRRA